jgi:tRNA A-37 threonylcarbamoyl transferase component Bud32
MSAADRDPRQGATLTINNRYEVDLDRLVGRGGMAVVYEGRDLKTRRRVAVKTLRPELQRDPDARKRFRREARMMRFVSHPNLVTIYDLIDASSGSWMVMEYVDGEDLRTFLDREGPLDPETVMDILHQAGGGLAHMHDNGLVHLDVKPQNLIQQPDGTIKLIDFGLAQRGGVPQDTVGGSAFGTAAYLAPEQASGDIVSPGTDIYSLGCVLYELLTGRTPYVAEGPDEKRLLIEAHLHGVPDRPSSVRAELNLPGWIDDVLGIALQRDVASRFSTMDNFIDAYANGMEYDEAPQMPSRTVGFRPIEREYRQTGILRRRQRPVRERISRPTPPVGGAAALDPVPAGPSLGLRLYRRGGRLVRHTGRLRRMMWKVTLLLLITNLMLGSILLVQDGPEALVERFLSIAPGTSTEVTVEALNLRSAPGASSPLLAVLGNGQEVRVTGLSEEDEQGRWWPIRVTVEGRNIEGWVWEGGLQPTTWTGPLSWMQDVVDGVSGTWSSITSGIGRAASILPGLTLVPAPLMMTA